MKKSSATKLPQFFKPLFWWCHFSSISPQEYKKTIIVQTLNYGAQKHLNWIIKRYGEREIKKIVEDMPESEFNSQGRERVFKVLKIKKLKFKTRNEKIKFLIDKGEISPSSFNFLKKKLTN